MSDQHALQGSIDYSIDDAYGVIFETWHGAVTRDVLLAFWRGFLTDARVLALKRSLVDLRDCEIRFSGEEWVRMIESCLLGKPQIQGWRVAIVVDRPQVHGIARQFLGNTADVTHGELFEHSDQALAWLRRRDEIG